MVEQKINIENKEKSYHTLSKQLEALIKDEPDITANLANASALLNQFLNKINWVGFYIWRETELVLGPFQGLQHVFVFQQMRAFVGLLILKIKRWSYPMYMNSLDILFAMQKVNQKLSSQLLLIMKFMVF